MVDTQADPYRFYASASPSATNPEVKQVTLVLPWGGDNSGAYRYPKIGEDVLVASQGTNPAQYFLMGYIPSASNPFNMVTAGGEGTKRIFEEKGEVLRYKNTTDVARERPYSEIGFYTAEKAQWPIKEKGETEENFPPISVLNLESAGNIRETAENHLLQKAKRMEIMVDCPEVVDRRTNKDGNDKLPLGDNPGDDSGLHKGDIHIRAGNRVIIKADHEMKLQVGRTELIITDQDFRVITRNMIGNYLNTYDTELFMHPRKGMTMKGKNINLHAGYRFNAGDNYGGSLTSTMGNINIQGRELSIDSLSKLEYGLDTLAAGIEFLLNTTSGILAMKKADHKIDDYTKYVLDNAKELIAMIKKFAGLLGERKKIQMERAEEARPAPAAENPGDENQPQASPESSATNPSSAENPGGENQPQAQQQPSPEPSAANHSSAGGEEARQAPAAGNPSGENQPQAQQQSSPESPAANHSSAGGSGQNSGSNEVPNEDTNE
jgi:hypothetical protein